MSRNNTSRPFDLSTEVDTLQSQQLFVKDGKSQHRSGDDVAKFSLLNEDVRPHRVVVRVALDDARSVVVESLDDVPDTREMCERCFPKHALQDDAETVTIA